SLFVVPAARRLVVLANEVIGEGTPTSFARATLATIDTTVHRLVSHVNLDSSVPGDLSRTLASYGLGPRLPFSSDGSRMYAETLPSFSGAIEILFSTFDRPVLRTLSTISVPLLSSLIPTAVPDRGRVYASAEDGALAVIDAATGAAVTKVILPEGSIPPPV